MTREELLQEMEKLIKGWRFVAGLTLGDDYDRGWNSAQIACARSLNQLLERALPSTPPTPERKP